MNHYSVIFAKKVVGLDRSVISKNVQNTKIGDMHNLLSQGHDMDYIARCQTVQFSFLQLFTPRGDMERVQAFSS